MPVYDRNGLVLERAFDIRGAVASPVYDVHGNVISEASESTLVPVGRQLTVMSYNVQWWSGYNNKVRTLDTIFSTHNPDILGVQEHSTSAKLDGVTPIGDYLASKFANVALGLPTSSGGTTMQAVASRLALTIDGDGGSRYDEIRYHNYQKMYIEYGGVKIAVFNTHLYWGGNAGNGYGAETRRAQAEKLFVAVDNAVKEVKYAIVIGDFNVLEASLNGSDYKNIIKPFIEEGYHCANPFGGVFYETCFEINNGVFETFPTDSIITSPNIRIDEVTVDYTKNGGNKPNNKAMDHMPLVAKLTVLVDPAEHESLLDRDGAAVLTSDGENILVVKES